MKIFKREFKGLDFFNSGTRSEDFLSGVKKTGPILRGLKKITGISRGLKVISNILKGAEIARPKIKGFKMKLAVLSVSLGSKFAIFQLWNAFWALNLELHENRWIKRSFHFPWTTDFLIHGHTTPKAWLKMSRPKSSICYYFWWKSPFDLRFFAKVRQFYCIYGN